MLGAELLDKSKDAASVNYATMDMKGIGMVINAENILASVEEAVLCHIKMSGTREDNEIPERFINPVAALLLYDKNKEYFYDVEIPFQDIVKANNPQNYNIIKGHVERDVGNYRADIVIWWKEDGARHKIQKIVELKIHDEGGGGFRNAKPDFVRVGRLASLLGDAAWSAVICGMICETPAHQLLTRVSKFQERMEQYSQELIQFPHKTSYIYREPVHARSKAWRWQIGACVLDFGPVGL